MEMGGGHLWKLSLLDDLPATVTRYIADVLKLRRVGKEKRKYQPRGVIWLAEEAAREEKPAPRGLIGKGSAGS
jgi:hypothetical protein